MGIPGTLVRTETLVLYYTLPRPMAIPFRGKRRGCAMADCPNGLTMDRMDAPWWKICGTRSKGAESSNYLPCRTPYFNRYDIIREVIGISQRPNKTPI